MKDLKTELLQTQVSTAKQTKILTLVKEDNYKVPASLKI